MSAIIAALVKFGPWLLGLAGVLFGAFRHQQASVAAADAARSAAEADLRAARSEAALAHANEAGASAGLAHAKARHDEDAVVDALPDGDAGRVLHHEWGGGG